MHDFRSRSYTPTKLFRRRIKSKLPPSELMNKLAEKQRKAEDKRIQILREKEESFRKARERENTIKQKLDEQAAQKLAKFNEKLEKAEMRKAQHLDNIKDKAKQEGDKLDENAFILSLTLQGKKIDLEDKIQINSERRQKKIEELVTKTIEPRERKREAFNKKREILREQSKDKFLAKTAKIESARKRKRQEVEKIRKNASTTIKKAIASRKRKKLIDNKINKLVSMISNINEDEWGKCSSTTIERNEKFERKKAKLKNQAKVLDKMISYTGEDKIEITQSETEDLFDDSSSSDEEDMMFQPKINRSLKAHSDTELDNEAIPFYFQDNSPDQKEGNFPYRYYGRCVYHALGDEENITMKAMQKAMSESPKNTEEDKESISKVGLSEDMLMKLNQHNMSQGNNSEIPGHGPMLGYYATPSIISSASNTTNTKTAKPKKMTKLMPNKKYLGEMKPITVLLKLTDSDSDSGYVSCQMTLAQDNEEDDENTLPETTSKLSSKVLENCSEFGASKESSSKVNTPCRTKRTMSIESNDPKTDCKTKDASTTKDNSS